MVLYTYSNIQERKRERGGKDDKINREKIAQTKEKNKRKY
jgi:hypothetical protein